MIPIGKPCKICKKTHVIKSDEVWDSLSVKEKTKAYKTEHRIFRDGYWRSYEAGNEVWEFYLPLTVHKTWIVEEAMKEKPEKRSLEESYEDFQIEDEDDYTDW